MKDVVAVDEALALFIAEAPGPLAGVPRYTRAPAGAELNVAVGLSWLSLRTGYISAVSHDSLGDALLAFMRGEGIDCAQIVLDPAHHTGLMFKSRRDDGADSVAEYFRRARRRRASARGGGQIASFGEPGEERILDDHRLAHAGRRQ
ncbi:PfkB family carbohydrate kinase [Cupriavidus necator]